MAVSYEQFMEATGAELVCGNIIMGQLANRRKVGEVGDDGVFNLNDEGKAIVAELEAGSKSPTTARKRKSSAAEAEETAPAAEPAPAVDPRLVDPT